MKYRIGRDAACGYGREGVEALTFLLLTPMIAAWLGPDDFGRWSFIWASVAFLGLLDLGLTQAVLRFLSPAWSRGDAEALRTDSASIFWVFVALAALGATAAAGLARILGSGADPDFSMALLLLGLRAALGLPASGLHAMLAAAGRQGESHILRAFETLLYAGIAVSLTGSGPSLSYLAGAALAACAVGLAAVAVRVRGIQGLSFRLRDVQLARIPGLLRFGGHFAVIQIAMLLYARVDAILINVFLPVAAVGMYAVGARVAEKAGAFCRQLANALTPALAGTGDDPEALIRLLVDNSRRSMLIATPLLLGLALLAGPLIEAWMGEAFLPAASVLTIFCGATWLAVLHAPVASALAMRGHERFVSRAFLLTQVLNLALTAALLPLLGLNGAVLATLISSSAADTIWIMGRAGRSLGLTRSRFYLPVLAPSLPGVAATIALTLTVLRPWLSDAPSLANVAIAETAIIAATAATTAGLTALRRTRLPVPHPSPREIRT